jgi:hypothetical protein
MTAKRPLNLVQSRHALSARLTIPKHDKTLSAHAAMGLCVAICALAEYLHVDLIRGNAIPATKVTIVRI